MKKALLLVLLALSMAACSHNARLHRGDLLFFETDQATAADSAISGATGSMVHVAIVDQDPDGTYYAIDATFKYGVSRRPLTDLLQGNKKVYVMRLKDDRHAGKYVDNALKMIGQPYDYTFLPGNDCYYCSELVRDCYVEDGEYIFDEEPMNFKNEEGGYDEFWVENFESLNMEIPQGVRGTNPTGIFNSDRLRAIDPSVLPKP